MAVGLGRAGRDATAVLAVALTMGTMNVYMGGSAKLAATLADSGALPAWLGRGAPRSVPRRPLAVIALGGTVMLAALIAGLWSTGALVRSTSACFVAVYVAALISATKILGTRARRSGAPQIIRRWCPPGGRLFVPGSSSCSASSCCSVGRE
jgi:amino acid efflux transporter